MIKSKPSREKALSNSEQRYRTLVETMGEGLTEVDENQVATYANEMLCRMWGRTQSEIVGQKVSQFLDDENKKILFAQHENRKKGNTGPYEIVWTKKDGAKLYALMTPTPYFDSSGKFEGSFAIVTDISKQKKEKNLLELRVQQRTRDLENKTKTLEEVNTALRVLLRKREEDKTILEERMVLNIRELVLPFIERMKEDKLSDSQRGCLNIVESTLIDIVSPFLHKLAMEFSNLTPSEIQVANMVKYGKTTKEIAQILNLSAKTIEFYRKRIRKKIGITNKTINLRTFLSSTK
ncbi:MAG: PAS domain S-box protein [Desulfobacula sp.]|nr:PAS domain S-box protein [Desulfobacula sp.]